MLWKIPGALAAAGSLCGAVLVYACAANTSGDCAENGTCRPPTSNASDADLAADSATADSDGGFDDAASEAPAQSGPQSDAAMETSDGAGQAAADSAGDAAADSAGEAAADSSREGSADAKSDGQDDGPVDASTCDPTQTPSQAACIIDDRYGVFVSPQGTDSNVGTRSHPVRTIGHGMAIASASGHRVFVCSGTYPEKVVVAASGGGTSVYGGLDCVTWTYGVANRVVVAPAETGYALEVNGVLTGVTFEDVEFDAQDANANNPGESSIAVFVHGGAQKVVLHRVVIVAGTGSAGAGGASGGTAGDPSNHFVPSPGGGVQSLDGNSAISMGGAVSKTCVCPAGSTQSTGGQGATPNVPAGGGLPSYGVDAGSAAGAPGINAVGCNQAGGGGDGVAAPATAADAPSATSGTLAATGWAPAAGRGGSNGLPGQGGGGGGDGAFDTGLGGGGACGGCGGAGGKAGMGGGSSIALLSYQSSVALVGCSLTAHDGGNGGPGGNGEGGQAGGFGGIQNFAGCSGGAGGTGAGGNGAQGGPGGLSAGIAYSSTAPNIDGTYVVQAPTVPGITVGKAGTGGPKGTAGGAATGRLGRPGADGAPGKDGTAQAVLAPL